LESLVSLSSGKIFNKNNKFGSIHEDVQIRISMAGCWEKWCIPVIPTLTRLKQKDREFKASLGYMVRLCLKKKKRISLFQRDAYYDDH
jgi:hypothetical protein